MAEEAAQLQAAINQETDETVESTRRMLTMMEEARNAGIDTLVNLDDQGEQLDRIEDGLNNVNKDMKEAEDNLAGMEKCCGLCLCPWQKSNVEKDEDYKKAFKTKEDGQVQTAQPLRCADERDAVNMSGNHIVRITNDEREDIMEENIGQLSSGLNNLKQMAMDMGNEVSSQNAQLSRVANKAKVLDSRLTTANQRADDLLN